MALVAWSSDMMNKILGREGGDEAAHKAVAARTEISVIVRQRSIERGLD